VNPEAVPPGEYLEKYTKDLTAIAKQGKLDPVIGRDEEIRKTIQVSQLSEQIYDSNRRLIATVGAL